MRTQSLPLNNGNGWLPERGGKWPLQAMFADDIDPNWRRALSNLKLNWDVSSRLEQNGCESVGSKQITIWFFNGDEEQVVQVIYGQPLEKVEGFKYLASEFQTECGHWCGCHLNNLGSVDKMEAGRWIIKIWLDVLMWWDSLSKKIENTRWMSMFVFYITWKVCCATFDRLEIHKPNHLLQTEDNV